MATPNSDPEAFRKSYFNQIAPIYALVTGNTTRDLFATLLDEQDLGLTDSSIIHDNAAGPGTATEALVPWCASRGISPRIFVTDYIPLMIEGFDKLKAKHNSRDAEQWSNVKAEVVDSTNLSDYGDGTFTHSICNFSIATFGDVERCVREIRRTLSTQGIAVFTAWKRFAAQDVVTFAQIHVKGKEWTAEHPIPVQGAEFMEEGHMADVVAQFGFEKGRLETSMSTKIVTEGEDWDGLFGFMTHPGTVAMATAEWTEEEKGRWPEAVKEGMLDEVKKFGGVKFEAWNVVARV